MAANRDLRLSAQRALLGRIHPEMRLIAIVRDGDEIRLEVLLGSEPSELVRSDISEAAAEIIADFPDARTIAEEFEVGRGELKKEDVIAGGWVYQRAE